jgi:hypothetical protein
VRVALLLLASLACRKEEAPSRRVAEVPVTPVAPVDAVGPSDAVPVTPDPEPDAQLAPVLDAGAVDHSQVTTAEWPTAIEVVMVERNTRSGHYDVDMSYPKFRVRPKALAELIAARLADITTPDLSAKDSGGSYELGCTLSSVSRIAIVARCDRMFHDTPFALSSKGMGGAPAGPTPHVFAWWLQPGLPAITIDQIAPGIDVPALFAQAKQVMQARCSWTCELDANSFVIGNEGIEFVPTEYCECARDFAPRIPLDQLQPTHPWAVKWIAWIRKRVDAGESLVKYER